jgi:Zn-dependent M28 family amino/carboxypeptidase
MSGAPDLTALAERLRRHVETVAATERPPNSSAHARTARYILDHLRAAGFTVKDDARTTAEGFGCRNLLTEPLPRDERLPLVVIGAHYDSVRGSPGADDNGSAVAALLELASWIRPHLDGAGRWHARLQLVAYDLEEYGLIGSQLQAAEMRKARTPLRGMISLEMLGYTDQRPGSQQLPSHLRGLYPDVANFIGVCANEASSALLGVVVAGLKSVAGLPVEYIAVPGTGELVPQVRLSDHSSYWDEGLPALMITDTSFFRNPHYHQKTDTPDKLDYPFLAKVTAGVCAAALQLLHAPKLS